MDDVTIFPTLTYDDAARAVDFLVDAYGFERHAVYTDDDGSIRHAELRYGNGLVMIGGGSAGGDAVYVVVADVDAHAEHARAHGAEITREPNDTDYGSREYAARDPEGKTWYFGTYQPFASG
jgi:uncharacterized glyoxalase superfamily protein PhnB